MPEHTNEEKIHPSTERAIREIYAEELARVGLKETAKIILDGHMIKEALRTQYFGSAAIHIAALAAMRRLSPAPQAGQVTEVDIRRMAVMATLALGEMPHAKVTVKSHDGERVIERWEMVADNLRTVLSRPNPYSKDESDG
jgi:hypothetical protein